MAFVNNQPASSNSGIGREATNHAPLDGAAAARRLLGNPAGSAPGPRAAGPSRAEGGLVSAAARPGAPQTGGVAPSGALPAGQRTLTDPAEIRSAETHYLHNFQSNYARLSPSEQRRFESLVGNFAPAGTRLEIGGGFGGMMGHANPTPEQRERLQNQQARHGLYALVASGDLTQRGRDGRTSLDHLEALQSQPLAPGIERRQLMASAVTTAEFSGFGQPGDSRAAVAAQRSVASEQPADFFRQVRELASPEGRSELHPGLTVQRRAVSSDAGQLYRSSIRPVAGRELAQLEIDKDPAARRAYDALTPAARSAYDRVLASQTPRGEELRFPVGGDRQAMEDFSARNRTEMQNDQALQTTRTELYDVLKSGRSRAQSVPELEAELRAHQRLTDYTPPQGELFRPPASEKERNPTLPSNEERARLVGVAMRTGQEQTVRNSEGQVVRVSITGRDDQYQLTLNGGTPVGVEFSGNFSADQKHEALERLTDYYSQIPAHLQGNTRRFLVEEKPHAKHLADASTTRFEGAGTIRFFGGLRNLTEDVFDHEYGHAVGTASQHQNASSLGYVLGGLFPVLNPVKTAPHGWAAAMEADAAAVSGYGKTNYKEDFAESFMAYKQAREYSPEIQAQLLARFPNRGRILREVFTPR